MPSSPKKPKKPKTNELICSHCDKHFAGKQSREKHEFHFHSDPQDADLVTASKAKYREYQLKYAAKKNHQCSECERSFSVKRDLEGHRLRIHADQKDPKVIAFKTEKNEMRRKYSGGTVKKTAVPLGSASGSADTGASSSASIGVESASSPLGGKVALLEKSGCDEMFKRSQHISQHSVDRIGVNMRIASLSSLNMALPDLGLPNLV